MNLLLEFETAHPQVLESVTELTTAEFLVSDMIVSPIPKESRISVLANHLGSTSDMVESIKLHLKVFAKLV